MRRAFSIVEVVIFVAVLAVIASIGYSLLSPREVRIRTLDTERLHNAKILEGALIVYFADERTYPDNAAIPTGLSNAKPVCTQGVVTDSTCVRFDALVGSGHITAIPRDDDAEPCPNYSGYKVHLTNGRAQIFPAHLGKGKGDSAGGCP